MTKRDVKATLQRVRDEAWQLVLVYERIHAIEPWPEQRSGSLTKYDIEASRLRGCVDGLDVAMRQLDLK